MKSNASFRRNHVNYIQGDEIGPLRASKDRIEEYAARVAKIEQFQPAGDLEELVAAFGGKVRYQHLDEWLGEDGSILVHAPNDFDILIPYYTSPLRDRFTIAHELGHYFLHSQQGKSPIIAYRRGATRIEREANWFAAGLLMPKQAFVEQFQRLGSLPLVAEYFGVSVDAARVRKESVCG